MDNGTVSIGATVTTGRICPRTGWWQCVDEGEVDGGRRQLFREGERMPPAVLLGKRSLWQRLTGEQPSYRTATVWTLVEYHPPPAPPAPVAEPTPATAPKGKEESSPQDGKEDSKPDSGEPSASA